MATLPSLRSVRVAVITTSSSDFNAKVSSTVEEDCAVASCTTKEITKAEHHFFMSGTKFVYGIPTIIMRMSFAKSIIRIDKAVTIKKAGIDPALKLKFYWLEFDTQSEEKVAGFGRH